MQSDERHKHINYSLLVGALAHTHTSSSSIDCERAPSRMKRQNLPFGNKKLPLSLRASVGLLNGTASTIKALCGVTNSIARLKLNVQSIRSDSRLYRQHSIESIAIHVTIIVRQVINRTICNTCMRTMRMTTGQTRRRQQERKSEQKR